MQRFSQRESVLLGYSPQKTFMNSSSAPRTPDTSSDIDFNDVFGGPPRRSSIQESRYSFSENNNMDLFAFSSDERAAASRNPWSGVSEKPFFGEEAWMSSRRRYSRNDFFDDIFRGNESLSSSPRKYKMKDPFAAGSQLSSPAKLLPPKAEPFGTFFPAQFSLPAKLNKEMDLPTFGSPIRSSAYKSRDGSSNGSNYYAFSPLSKFSSGQANQDKEEVMTNDFQSSRRFGDLSQELSFGTEKSTNLAKHDETETSDNLKEDSNSSKNSKKGRQFHFSIYKWADKGGVPLAIPLRGSDKVKEKDKLQRCSSSKGWIACENIAMEPKAKLHGSFRSTDRMSRSTKKSFRVEHDINDNGSFVDSRDEDGEPDRVTVEDNIPMSESEIVSNLKSSGKNISADTDLHNPEGEEKTHHSLPPVDLHRKGEKEVSSVGKETNKPQPKPLTLLLDDDNVYQQGKDERTRNAGTKETNIKLSEILDSKNIKKQDMKKKATSNKVEASKTGEKGSPRKSWDNGKNKVRGKVKEFIKIFNQDASSKPSPDTVSESNSSRRKERDTVKPENEPSISINERDEKTHMSSIQTNKSSPDIPVVNHMRNGASEKNIDSSVKDSVSNGSKTTVEDPAGSFEDYILAIYTKIRQWSNGKQGNIRSLLSTLQHVLWPDSGWKPVPLVDIIEGPSVKRSYQKALLCLHPDKLQQKGASSDQKYIAEKVFDILQEAWTHFNSLGPL